MTDLGSQISTGLQVLALPTNAVLLLVGTLGGALAGALFRTIGLHAASSLVLLLPFAALLDPQAGLILLGSALVSALIAPPSTQVTPASLPPSLPPQLAFLLATVAAVLVLLLASVMAAALSQSASPGDKIALLLCGAAAAVLLSTAAAPSATWFAPALLMAAGIGLQLSPVPPLDLQRASPIPVLLGLLAIGPALFALAWPLRITTTTATSGSLEFAATVLPAFLIGVPVARNVATFAVNLGEQGLYLGPRLMTQRPKLMLGFVLALVGACVLSLMMRVALQRLPGPGWLRSINTTLATRLAAGAIAALCMAVVMRGGLDADGMLALGAAVVVGAAAAGIGVELSLLVTGLVIGLLMQPLLQTARIAAKGDTLAALTSGSWLLLVLAVAAMGAAIAWPFWARRRQVA
jgi:hypothetical protein